MNVTTGLERIFGPLKAARFTSEIRISRFPLQRLGSGEGTVNQTKLWHFDVDADERFWFVSDHPKAHLWKVEIVCRLTRATKVEAAETGFVNIMGTPRRAAWQVTPFTQYGYAQITVMPDSGEPFLAVPGRPY